MWNENKPITQRSVGESYLRMVNEKEMKTENNNNTENTQKQRHIAVSCLYICSKRKNIKLNHPNSHDPRSEHQFTGDDYYEIFIYSN